MCLIDALGAALVRKGGAYRRAARLASAVLLFGVVALIVLLLHEARLDYARAPVGVGPWDKICGVGLGTCSENASCQLDDYTYALPVGHCERLCEREYQTCWRGRECRYDGPPRLAGATLKCVRVYDHYR